MLIDVAGTGVDACGWGVGAFFNLDTALVVAGFSWVAVRPLELARSNAIAASLSRSFSRSNLDRSVVRLVFGSAGIGALLFVVVAVVVVVVVLIEEEGFVIELVFVVGS